MPISLLGLCVEVEYRMDELHGLHNTHLGKDHKVLDALGGRLMALLFIAGHSPYCVYICSVRIQLLWFNPYPNIWRAPSI